MLNWNSPQVWIFLLVIGFGALRWIAVQLQEQAKVRASKERARREYEEQLRTGRSAEPYPNRRRQEAKAADELASRRQAQLKELRRRQGDRTIATPGAGEVSGESVERILGGILGGVVVRAPTVGPGGVGGVGGVGGRGGVIGPAGVVIQRIPGAGGAANQGRRAASPGSPIPQGGKPPASGLSLGQVRRQEQTEREATARRAELQEQSKFAADRRSKVALQAARSAAEAKTEMSPAQSPHPARGFSLRDAGGRPLPAAELRRLLILGEVLGKPMADRDPRNFGS